MEMTVIGFLLVIAALMAWVGSGVGKLVKQDAEILEELRAMSRKLEGSGGAQG